MEKIVDNETLLALRKKNLISNDEVVYSIGDLMIAENVLTKLRRNIDVSILSESSRGLLKG
jgi:hypothetical protein